MFKQILIILLGGVIMSYTFNSSGAETPGAVIGTGKTCDHR